MLQFMSEKPHNLQVNTFLLLLDDNLQLFGNGVCTLSDTIILLQPTIN